MTNTNATNLRRNLFAFLNSAIEFHDVIHVSTKNGNAIILSEQEYNGLLETLYLCSIPDTKERLEKGLQASAEDYIILISTGDLSFQRALFVLALHYCEAQSKQPPPSAWHFLIERLG